MQPTQKYFRSQRLELRYEDWGNETAPALLLIHGGRDQARSWDTVATQLCKKWHVVAPHLRGHGDSAHSPDCDYETFSYVCDLAALVSLVSAAPVSLLGHSLGANISLRYTALYPERVARLIAVEGMMTAPAIEQARYSVGVRARFRHWVDRRTALASRTARKLPSTDAAVQRMREVNPRLSRELAQKLCLQGTRHDASGKLVWKFDPAIEAPMFSDLSPEDFATLMRSIPCATLLIYGQQSPASLPSQDGRLHLFPKATSVVFEDAGHWVQHDQPQMFIDRVSEFLRQ